MSSTKPAGSAGLTPTECVRLLAEHWRRWMIPTFACAVLATAYALVMTRYWQATRALVVRHEVTTSTTGQPGKFADLVEMRTFQETILELVKSRQVIAATLQAVAQAESGRPAAEPTDQLVESFRKRLSMLPPAGAEFGKTEVFYLGVIEKSRDRAENLVSELTRQLDARLRRLRNDQAQSVIAVLEKQVEFATAAQETHTERLVHFETQVGPDLGELRMLHSAASGSSDLRQQAVQLESKSRESAVSVHKAEQLLVVLKLARQHPEQLVAMPLSLLNSQPTLRRLKDGLFDAQLRAAHLGGRLTADHPQVQAAQEEVERIRQDLHNELQIAIRGVQIELDLSRSRYIDLKDQLHKIDVWIANLAQQRSEYSNRVAALENSCQVLDQARKQLTAARAEQVAAHSASLVTLLDKPDAGTHPVGISRSSVLLVGTIGGLVLGLGWTFLTVTPPSPAPRDFKSTPTTPELSHSTATSRKVPVAAQAPSLLQDVNYTLFP